MYTRECSGQEDRREQDQHRRRHEDVEQPFPGRERLVEERAEPMAEKQPDDPLMDGVSGLSLLMAISRH